MVEQFDDYSTNKNKDENLKSYCHKPIIILYSSNPR